MYFIEEEEEKEEEKEDRWGWSFRDKRGERICCWNKTWWGWRRIWSWEAWQNDAGITKKLTKVDFHSADR